MSCATGPFDISSKSESVFKTVAIRSGFQIPNGGGRYNFQTVKKKVGAVLELCQRRTLGDRPLAALDDIATMLLHMFDLDMSISISAE
jgi:hypothetical protein